MINAKRTINEWLEYTASDTTKFTLEEVTLRVELYQMELAREQVNLLTTLVGSMQRLEAYLISQTNGKYPDPGNSISYVDARNKINAMEIARQNTIREAGAILNST